MTAGRSAADATPAQVAALLRGPERVALARTRTPRVLGLAAGLVVLLAAVLASLTIGAQAVPVRVVWEALTAYDPTQQQHLVVVTVRLPRMVVGVLVGAALGAAGALMQGLTRNPLADPGILGVNAGASLFVVFAIYWLGVASLTGYVWFAFAGAAVTGAVVYLLGSRGRDGATPVKMTLAGAAVQVLATSAVGVMLLSDRDTSMTYRFWAVGSVAGRTLDLAAQVAPFIALGLGLALVSGRVLNALSLGDDLARSLGQHVTSAKVLISAAIVLLCGAATAVAGPVFFVGLLVPHAARIVTGPDYRWIVPYAMVLGGALLPIADVVGRVVVAPSELPAGVVVAVIGGPLFILIARRRSLVEL